MMRKLAVEAFENDLSKAEREEIGRQIQIDV